MRTRIALATLAAIAVAGCTPSDTTLAPTSRQPELSVAPTGQPDRYIVVYRSSVSDTRAEISSHVDARNVRVEHVYDYALHGWAGEVTPGELQRLRNDPHVAYVEKDAVVTTLTTQAPTPSWGLDRIDQRNLPLNQSYTYATTGAGVHFYGIDTGILYSHVDFGGRASPGFDAVTPGGGAVDCNGHGTHTASTAAGTTYGVAKGMTIIGVRVLDCSGSGTNAGVIAGVDWVTQNAIKPAVANMSLGGGLSSALDQAVANSIASGVVYAIASGNSNADACADSPADVPTALTVNASDINDNRASFSNFGTCTDIFAPGVGITAAWGSGNTATATVSGTSMATPHVAGVAGLYLQANPSATPAQVAAALTSNATANVIVNPGTGSPNKLLYMGFITGGGTNQPPTASITAPANNASFAQGSSVSFSGSGSDPEDGTLTGASLVWTSSINGRIGTGTSFSTSTLSVGTHMITLTATDSKGATGTATRTIVITPPANQPPVAAFTFNCTGFNVNQCLFDGSGSTDNVGIVLYTWNWGDGRSESHSTPSTRNTWSQAGTYNVTLTVKDGGGLTNSITKSVVVGTAPPNQPPTATITAPANNASFGQGSSVTFSGSGSDPEDGTLTGASLVWTSSINGQIGAGTSFSTSALSVGTHTITLTATDSKGATGTATRSITITAPNQPPTATITAPANNASFGQGSSVTFSGSGSDPEDGTLTGASLVWTSSINGQIGAGTSFSTSALSVGTHTITLTATDSKGATGTATRSITITAVNQPPVARFTVNCVGFRIHQCNFDATGSTDDVGIVKYSWAWGDGRTESHTTPVTKNTWPQAGSYNVTLTVTDGGGLTNSTTMTVAVP